MVFISFGVLIINLEITAKALHDFINFWGDDKIFFLFACIISNTFYPT